MTASKKMVSLEDELINLGHGVVLPEFTRNYAKLDSQEKMRSESAHNKIQYDLIRGYFDIIKKGDSVLIANETRKGIENYIGGNTLIEMGFAHVLRKPIYLLNPVPEMPYSDEINAMNPIILNKDLTKIKCPFH